MEDKRIKSSSQLPEWAVKTPDEIASQFLLSDWWTAFRYRSNTKFVIDAFNKAAEADRLDNNCSEMYMQHIEEHFNRCFEHIESVYARVAGSLGNKEAHHPKLTNLLAIHKGQYDSPLRVFSDRSVIQCDPEERESLISQAMYNLRENDPFKGVELDDNGLAQGALPVEYTIKFMLEKINKGVVFLEVDSFASDIQLKDDFERWLKQFRKLEPTPDGKDVSDAKVVNWVKYRLLEYIDLTLWSNYKGLLINQVFLSNYLYKDEEFVNPSRLSTTLPNLMEQVLSEDYQNKLHLRASMKY